MSYFRHVFAFQIQLSLEKLSLSNLKIKLVTNRQRCVHWITTSKFFLFYLILIHTNQFVRFAILSEIRSSHRKCSIGKCVLKNFAKLIEKRLR